MKRLLAVCAGSLFLVACNDATAPTTAKSSTPTVPANGPSADIRPGHYIVVLKSGATSSEAVLNRHSFRRAVTMDQHFKTVVQGFAAAVADEDLESLRNDPDVERIEPDRYVHQLGAETGMGWALDRVDQHAMPLNGTFDYGATGSGVNIYVVDGGIRYTHTEFGGRAHFAYDALGGDGSDCNGHGTGVAGIAAGSVHGVAKAANIYSVRVFPCSGTTNLSTILAGVDWVTAHHRSPAVANLSLGAAAAPILDTAVERSIRSGVTYVVAGGNNGGDACAMSPGKLPDVITVGATDASDTRASWSNYGSCVHMFAPGVAVPSADYYSDVALASWNGTSMSAPMVSGAVALYLQGHPTASPSTVRSAILGNSTTSLVKNTSGSANRLLYTSFVGSVTAPTTTTTAPTPTPIASVTGIGVAYKCASGLCGFDASASAPSGGVASYAWRFGDGTTATGRTVSHKYGSSASYTWALDIVSGTGNKYSTGKSITPASASGSSTSTTPTYVAPTTTYPVPAAIAGVGGVGVSYKCVSGKCGFDASGSQPTGGVTSYLWYFGDGSTSTSRAPTHTYGSASSYTWSLTIVTGTGKKYYTSKSITPASASGSSTSTVPIYVPPTTSTFTANFTVSCNAMHSCTFDASSSVIPNGVSSYNWWFGDGYEGTTVRLTHDYSGPKTVSVILKIYDKTLAYRTITKTVTVP